MGNGRKRAENRMEMVGIRHPWPSLTLPVTGWEAPTTPRPYDPTTLPPYDPATLRAWHENAGRAGESGTEALQAVI